jgi:hypothetical protein
MQKIIYILGLLLAISGMAQSQTNLQMRNWFISPKKVEMPFGSNPTVTSLPTGAPNCLKMANGMYDVNNNLLFYVSDGNVYDYNSTLIGAITPAPQGGEIAIVPFGDNDNSTSLSCKRKYSIFSTGGGYVTQTSVVLVHTVLDLNSFSLISTIVDNMPWQQEFGCLAVSKANGIGSRFVYFMAASGYSTPDGELHKVILDKNGNVSAPTVVLAAFPYSGYQLFSRELELSPDGKWLAWARFLGVTGGTDRYQYVELNPTTGDMLTPTSYYKFSIPSINGNNASGFRGLEFFQTGTNTYRLFMGAGSDGIYFTNFPTNSTFNQVTNSTFNLGYGFSQIELSFNGNLYVSSANTSTANVGAFDPNSGSPTISTSGFPSLTLTSPLPPNSSWQGVPFYTLPDQIDGENYGNSLAQPIPLPLPITRNTITVSGGTTSTWSITANPATNPWGIITSMNPKPDAQVIKEIRIIGTNTHLIISGMKIKFSPEAKVIIEEGSTLTLDDLSGTPTILSSDYNDDPCLKAYSWIGVEVWGNKAVSQNAVPLSQGKLIIRDGSWIEYAKWGASAWKPTPNHTSPTTASLNGAGGIINVLTSGAFKNCRVGVEFKPYQNFNPSNPSQLLGNKSSFNTAQFNNNSTYINVFNSAPTHASIDGCTGIVFTNCSFSHNNTVQAIYTMASYGIKSNNANFSVINNTTFSNLFRGIDAYRTVGNTNTFYVANSTFTDNEVGIHTTNINNFTVLLNTFNVGGNKRGGGFHYGIRNWYGSGFRIEENSFALSANQIGTVQKLGVHVTSTGTASNQIYKNTFSGITYGNYANGQNRASGAAGTLQGLQYLCNKNLAGMVYDFTIIPTGTNMGIRLNQGSMAYPAGNEFISTGLSNSHFFNNTSDPLNYYYKSGATNQTPTLVNSAKVIPISASGTNTCPSLICNPPCDFIILNPADIQQLYSDYDNSETAYLNLLYSYNQLMDGGSTNQLLIQMQQTWSSDATAFRDELIELSPYLSQEALREAAERNILPDAMMLMVCLANPDATRGDDFINYMQYDCPNPLPQYMIDLIIASWDDATPRTTMENLLAKYNSDMSYTSNKILDDLYFKSTLDLDSIDPNDTTDIPNQIIYWLNRIQTITAKYDLIENYFATGNNEDAQTLIAEIPNDFTLTDEQLQAHNDYIYFYDLRNAVLAGGREISQLEEAEIQELMAFTEARENFATRLAQNILCFYYDICREDGFEEPSGERIMHSGSNLSGVNISNQTENVKSTVFVTPNPATNMAVFSYAIASKTEIPVLTITDVNGKKVTQFIITDEKGEINWDTSKVRNGFYYYNVKSGKMLIAKGKITVRK